MISWKDDYSVHVKAIDGQHKKFFALINKLATIKSGERAAIGTVLDELIDYATYHFSAEERLMQQHGYPRFEEHCGYHREFMNKALLLKNDFGRGKDIEPSEVMEWAGAWLHQHILRRDLEYAPYVTAKKK
ncbi:MAG: bacteriohemerythrin [Planctomycetota bacterium]|nr:bacteriohemerythrin [Planctomycetota bacterium]